MHRERRKPCTGASPLSKDGHTARTKSLTQEGCSPRTTLHPRVSDCKLLKLNTSYRTQTSERLEQAGMAKSVADLIKDATEAVKDVPESLKEVAFGKAFDALLTEQQSGSTDGHANAKGRRTTTSKASKNPTSQLKGESNRSLLDQLDRTLCPEITHDGTALTNSLRILRAARDELGIDGVSGSDITHLLNDKFRCKVTRQAVSMALNDASQFVNRHKVGNAVIFRIMSRGEQHLDDLDAGVETDSNPTKKRKSTKTVRTAKKKDATAKSSSQGASKKKTASKRSLGAFAAVSALLVEGFFAQPRTIASTIEHLKHNLGRTF